MQLRQAIDKDCESLVRLYSQYQSEFPLDLSNSFAHRVAIKDSEVLAFGWLQLTVESNIIWNLNSRDRFQALRLILDDGKKEASAAGFDQVHAFPKDPKFSEILKKHYDFKNVIGDALVLNLDR